MTRARCTLTVFSLAPSRAATRLLGRPATLASTARRAISSRDVIRLRTNYRKDPPEDVYVYPVRAPRENLLLRERKPFVREKALADFAVTYELNVYTDTPAEMNRLYGLLHQNILDAFNEYGIQIMTPAYEGDPEQPKLVPREQWFSAPARPPSGEGTP